MPFLLLLHPLHPSTLSLPLYFNKDNSYIWELLAHLS
jgi:hypothetical protein